MHILPRDARRLKKRNPPSRCIQISVLIPDVLLFHIKICSINLIKSNNAKELVSEIQIETTPSPTRL